MTSVVGGDLKRTDLCEECARKTGAIQPTGFVPEEVHSQEIAVINSEQETACPSCGYPLDSLQKTGRLGCATCYEKFSVPLHLALVESQKSLTHHGKRPAHKDAGEKEWEAEMQHFVATENFEEAARLRDRIARGKPASKKKVGSA
ncbi:MAG: UvrB/UvrC motif-containing protein [Verrucomicrobia bacterium]|nr:UvrB/UvrC motif-containing protein [Verrucomicrobiota bacterium]